MQDPKATTPEVKAAEPDASKQPAKVTEPDGNKATPPAVVPTETQPETKQV